MGRTSHRCDRARLSAAAQVIRARAAFASLANASAVQTHLPLAKLNNVVIISYNALH
jgi:hypothetical protein